MVMYTYTHNPTCTLVLLRTNREVEFSLNFFVCLFLPVIVVCEKDPVLSQLLISCELSSSIFSLCLVIMAEISLRVVKFGSFGN